MSTCSQCGTSYPSHVRFCTKDGAVLGDEAPAEAAQIGKVLAGKYRLDAYLSKGGMGSVFRATHLMLEKQVALKVIKPELVGSSEFVRRFQREARAATSLNHPHIVGVYDLGQADDGALYIAMEFVDGPSLKEAIRIGGPMEPLRIAHLMRQILSALALAHRHHIVHRDLKPQNIMLTTDRDGAEIVKLVDFGIAKTFDDRTQLTATGFAIGTPQYMAPEQASGAEVDGRSDLYSLGIILYEMLVAEVPFNDPSTPAILVKHLTETPVRPSLRRTDVAVHRGLEDVAVRCLEKEPAKRYQTAEEVAQAIAAAVGLEAGAPLLPAVAPVSMGSTMTAARAAQLASAPHPASAAGGTAAARNAQTAAAAPAVAAVNAPMPASTTPALAGGAAAPAAAPAAVNQGALPPVVKSGRSSLALGIGALGIVALAGMGFALQRFVGSDTTPSAPTTAESTAPAAATPSVPTPQPPLTPPDSSAAPPAAVAAVSSEGGAPSASPAAAAAAGASEEPAPPEKPAAQPTSTAQSGEPAPKVAATGAPDARRGRSSDARGSQAGQALSGGAAAARTREVAAAPPPSPTPAVPAAAAGTVPPAPAQLPEHPVVLLRCDGAPEVCGAVRDAFGAALERETMPTTSSAPRADVYVVVAATAVDGQVQQQFGTTFVVRNYTISVELEAPRLESSPRAPQSRTFSADLRVGRERINENARLVANDTVQRIREFWTRRRAAGN